MKEETQEKTKNNALRCLSGILLLIFILIFLWLYGLYESNYKYSIAMPTILGEFKTRDDFIQISGLNNIKNDDIATLTYTEITCIPSHKYCNENRFSIIGLGNEISIFPYHYEYIIKYSDKNKILFEEDARTSGEIDLNAKTLIYTIKKAGINNNETRRIEILTDNKEIEKLEKKIIRKYLKKKLFN